MALFELLKRHVAKWSLQRSFNNKINYKVILDLCENEIMLIKFLGIFKESMIIVENLEIEKWREGGDTALVTQRSHHLVPLSFSWIGPKLTSEDYMLIFSLPAYVTCVYNSFWWVGTVSLVDIAAGDIINIDFMHPHGPWQSFN